MPLITEFYTHSTELPHLRIAALETYSDVVTAGTDNVPTQALLRSLAVQQSSTDGSDGTWLYVGGVKSVRLITKVLASADMLPWEHSKPHMGNPLRNPMPAMRRDVIEQIMLFPPRQTGFYAVLSPLPEHVHWPIAEASRATSSGKQAKRMARVAAGGEAPSWMPALQVEALRRCPADKLVKVADPSELASQTPAPKGSLHSQGFVLRDAAPDAAACEKFEQAGRLHRDAGSSVVVPRVCELPLPPAPAAPRRTRATDAASGQAHMFPKSARGGCELDE